MVGEALLMEAQARLDSHDEEEEMHARDAAELHKVRCSVWRATACMYAYTWMHQPPAGSPTWWYLCITHTKCCLPKQPP